MPHPRDQPVDSSRIAAIRMGTTVATNALLERQGARCVLLITEGFGDLLQIGNQARPRIFDLEIARPQLLYERAIEVRERVRIVSNQVGFPDVGDAPSGSGSVSGTGSSSRSRPSSSSSSSSTAVSTSAFFHCSRGVDELKGLSAWKLVCSYSYRFMKQSTVHSILLIFPSIYS